MEVLVIRSAREHVLRGCLERIAAGARVTVLGQRARVRTAVDWVDAPPGPLAWRRLDREARAALRSRRWSEVVVLHNLGDEGYADVLALALRAAPLAPLRVYYADGVECRHHSALTLAATRGAWTCMASAVLGLLMLAAVPFATVRSLRS